MFLVAIFFAGPAFSDPFYEETDAKLTVDDLLDSYQDHTVSSTSATSTGDINVETVGLIPEEPPKSDSTLDIRSESYAKELKSLLSRMKAEEEKGFLSYQADMYSDYLKNLQLQIEVSRQRLGKLDAETAELGNLSENKALVMQILLYVSVNLEREKISLVAKMLSGNLNLSGSNGVCCQLEAFQLFQHPYFETAWLTLKLASLNSKISRSLRSYQQLNAISGK